MCRKSVAIVVSSLAIAGTLPRPAHRREGARPRAKIATAL
jgi:hypothetical protein